VWGGRQTLCGKMCTGALLGLMVVVGSWCRLEGVWFAYPQRQEVEVLRGLDLHIRQGQVRQLQRALRRARGALTTGMPSHLAFTTVVSRKQGRDMGLCDSSG
jgi:hypothetical protein